MAESGFFFSTQVLNSFYFYIFLKIMSEKEKILSQPGLENGTSFTPATT
jgi:hypothetical protein